jgi:hypothetical protein
MENEKLTEEAKMLERRKHCEGRTPDMTANGPARFSESLDNSMRIPTIHDVVE